MKLQASSRIGPIVTFGIGVAFLLVGALFRSTGEPSAPPCGGDGLRVGAECLMLQCLGCGGFSAKVSVGRSLIDPATGSRAMTGETRVRDLLHIDSAKVRQQVLGQ